MVNSNISDYIKNTRDTGYNDDQIKRALKNKGWNDNDVNDAFLSLDKLELDNVEMETMPIAPSSEPKQDYSYNNLPSTKTNTLAIISFVLTFFIPIIGFILAFVALRQIKKTGEKGKGFAVAAIIISVITIFISVLAFVAYFGMLDPARLLPERCQSSAGMDCISLATITPTGVSFSLRNNIGYPISVSGVQGNVCKGPAGGVEGVTNEVLTNNEFVPFDVNNNQVFKLKIDCNLKSGRKFDDSIILTYRNTESGQSRDVPIDIRGKVS